MNLRYRVELSQAPSEERQNAVRPLKRSQILLAADAGASDDHIVTSDGVGSSTVYRTKRSLEAALHGRSAQLRRS